MGSCYCKWYGVQCLRLQSPPRREYIIASWCCPLSLVILDPSVLTLSSDPRVSQYSLNLAWASAIVTVYLLTPSMRLCLYGWLGAVNPHSKYLTAHWNWNVVIFTSISSLAAPNVVILITFGATNDENVVKMTTFPFQCGCMSWSRVSFVSWLTISLHPIPQPFDTQQKELVCYLLFNTQQRFMIG